MKAALFIAIVEATGESPAPEDPASAPQGGGSSIFMWVLLIGVAVLMYVMSRRNKKKQGDADAFRTELAPGQRVMTMSGLVGVISRVEGDVITIASANGDESAWIRRAIRSLVPDDEWTSMTSDYPDDPDDSDAEPETSADDPEAPDGDAAPGIDRP
ncbi:MAG: preprotein translocase subunit YajC [Bifidobacteriaceae bacterium]|nr:preprotein translocase subunit YajC [Bifidobacteriaceae bacterium]